jgi:hypothetical protein
MDPTMQTPLSALDRTNSIFANLDATSEDANNARSRQAPPHTQPGEKKPRKPRHKTRANKPLHQVIWALTGGTLRHEKRCVQPADGVQKNTTRLPRGRKRPGFKQLTDATDALENATVVVQEKGAEQGGSKRTTCAMDGTLPLAFDSSYLRKVGNDAAFMNNGDIMTWIGSVSHHLKGWYCECVCDPANETDLQSAQSDPIQFADAVFQHEFKSPGAAKAAKPSVGADEGALKRDMVSNFVQLTAIVSRRIERDGQRGGGFALCKKSRHVRQAAIWLLVTVIMDLTVNMGYFIRLFLGILDANLTVEDEQILLALGDGAAQPFHHPHSTGAAPRTLTVRADLFESVSETFENLPKSTGCRVLVHTPSGADLVRFIVLIGSAAEMDSAEEVITEATETSATPWYMDLP